MAKHFRLLDKFNRERLPIYMGENQFFTGPEFRLHQRAGMTFLSNFKSLDEAKRFYPDVEDPNKYKVEDEASHMDKGRVVKYSGIAVYKIDHSD